MNAEVEIKIKCRNFTALKKSLKKARAKLIGKVRQIDTYYLVEPDSRFRLAPRLRVRDDLTKKKSFLEYHVPDKNYRKTMSCREYEVLINKPETMKFIIQNLGFKKDVVISKTREKYQLGQINIDLDSVKGLGHFAEFEIINRGYKSRLKSIYALVEKLGLNRDDSCNGLTYLDMAWEKLKK